jgi:hypothetical protein
VQKGRAKWQLVVAVAIVAGGVSLLFGFPASFPTIWNSAVRIAAVAAPQISTKKASEVKPKSRAPRTKMLLGDVTISAPTTFAAADASDGTPDGVFTVTGNLTITGAGSITCNNGDPGSSLGNGCNINIVVSGNMTMQTGSAITANTASDAHHAGNITITVGNFAATPPTGDFNMASGSTIQANATGSAGAIVINVAHEADVDGLV